MEAEKVINDMYENALDNRPSFTPTMVEHMRNEVERIKQEAIEWVKNHKESENN